MITEDDDEFGDDKDEFGDDKDEFDTDALDDDEFDASVGRRLNAELALLE